MSRPYRGKKIIHKPDGSLTIVTRLGPRRRSGGGAGGCFPSSTSVLTPTGWRAIADLYPNDLIVSYDAAAKTLSTREIICRIDYGLRQVWEIRFADSEPVLQTTSSHSFLCTTGWKRASKLRPGDILLRRDASKVVESTVESAGATETELEVHNLHTSVECNFIVQGGIIAHNFSYFRALRAWLQTIKICKETGAALTAPRWV